MVNLASSLTSMTLRSSIRGVLLPFLSCPLPSLDLTISSLDVPLSMLTVDSWRPDLGFASVFTRQGL